MASEISMYFEDTAFDQASRISSSFSKEDQTASLT